MSTVWDAAGAHPLAARLALPERPCTQPAWTVEALSTDHWRHRAAQSSHGADICRCACTIMPRRSGSSCALLNRCGSFSTWPRMVSSLAVLPVASYAPRRRCARPLRTQLHALLITSPVALADMLEHRSAPYTRHSAWRAQSILELLNYITWACLSIWGSFIMHNGFCS